MADLAGITRHSGEPPPGCSSRKSRDKLRRRRLPRRFSDLERRAQYPQTLRSQRRPSMSCSCRPPLVFTRGATVNVLGPNPVHRTNHFIIALIALSSHITIVISNRIWCFSSRSGFTPGLETNLFPPIHPSRQRSETAIPFRDRANG